MHALTIATSIGYRCICCGIAVEKSNSRTKVFGPLSTSLLVPFEDHAQKALPQIDYLPSDRSKLYWCLKCFAKLEKVTKLRKEVKRLDDEILRNISSFGEKLGLRRQVEEDVEHVAALTPTRSYPIRRRLVELMESHPQQKRMKLDTPEHETLSKIIVTTTPNISVCIK